MSRSRRIVTLAVLTSTLVVAPALAETRHSGVVQQVAPDTLVIEEMGPWTGTAQGLRVLTVRVRPDTPIDLAQRSDENVADAAPASWPGGFVDMPGTDGDVRPGDFVTVFTDDAVRANGPITATRIVVVPETGVSASPATLPPRTDTPR